MGPQYTGLRISRNALLGDESDDDPFGSHSEKEEQEEVDTAKYADPELDLEDQEGDEDEEIDSDEAFQSGDEMKFTNFRFGNSRAGERNSEEEGEGDDDGSSLGFGSEGEDDAKYSGVDGPDNEGDEMVFPVHSERSSSASDNGNSEDIEIDDEDESERDGGSDSSVDNTPKGAKSDDRAALRKMMAEEQKTIQASLSEAAKADVSKGRAIKQQRSTFDSILNTRIKLQKALIATNSMSASTSADSVDHREAIQAAETAALNLWTSISSLRSSLQPADFKKRPFAATIPTSTSTLWAEMQSQESISLPQRRATLTKWSQKTNPATALPRANKFSQTPAQQPLTSVLDQQLSGSNAEKLLKRTRTPRSCAPLQATARTTEDPAIYDDADFYTLLLRELVDQRMADSNTTAPIPNGNANSIPALPSQHDFKVKKPVDTKASKGRKMRYTVHEKLQNFMAPEDRGSWGERQRSELFGSLLGRRIRLGEYEEEGMGSEGDGDEDGMDGVEVEGGLKLFAQ